MKTSTSFFLLLCALISATLFSCQPEETPEPIVLLPNLNGLYITGSNTVATEIGTPESKVNLAVLDPGKGAQVNNLENIYGKFIHIGANSTIELTFVENEVGTTYGAANGGSIDSAITVSGSFNDLVIHGELLVDGPAIKIAEAGLYYLFVNMEDKSFILMEVKANIIGDATEQQWAAGTDIPLKSSSATESVFELTNVPLIGASGYRYRFNDGWHVYEDNRVVTLSSLGVVSYGEAWDTGINDLGYYLDNAAHKESGLFTITLTFDAETGTWSETKTKTGDLLVDYSDAKFGWFGNAFYVDGMNEANWESIHHTITPTQDSGLYNWTWTMELIEDRAFVIREDADNGAWITYGGAAKFGAAFTDSLIVKEDGQDNYFVAKGGTYQVTFTINPVDEGRILTINPE